MCNQAGRVGIKDCFVDQFNKVIVLSCEKSNGFYLFNGECREDNIIGFFKDDFSGWYLKCDCNCITCDQSPRKCTTCPFGF